MYYEFFIQTSELLRQSQRFQELLDLCRRAAPAAYFRQYRALCMWTQAESYYHNVGDAPTAREKHIEFLDFIDSDRSIIPEVPGLQEVMEDMYVSSCTSMCDLSISYDEFESYMSRSEQVRPLTPNQLGQRELIESMKQEGRDWTFNIIALAARVTNNNEVQAQAAALWSLLLYYRRELRVSREDINTAIVNFTMCTLKSIESAVAYSKEARQPCYVYNLGFILDKAIAIDEKFMGDMATKDEAQDAVEHLNRLKTQLIDLERAQSSVSYWPRYKSREDLNREIEQQLAITDHTAGGGLRARGAMPKPPPATQQERVGAVLKSIMYLIVSGLCGFLAFYGERGVALKVIMIILMVVFLLVSIVMFANRKYSFKNGNGQGGR